MERLTTSTQRSGARNTEKPVVDELTNFDVLHVSTDGIDRTRI